MVQGKFVLFLALRTEVGEVALGGCTALPVRGLLSGALPHIAVPGSTHRVLRA